MKRSETKGSRGKVMTKSEYDVIEVDVPPFGMYVEVWLDDFSKIPEWIKSEFEVEIPELPEDHLAAGGLTIDLAQFGADGYVVVCLKDFKKNLRREFIRTIGILSHECLHATKAVFESRDIPFTPENEEVIAYTQEGLVETILTKINERKKNGKN